MNNQEKMKEVSNLCGFSDNLLVLLTGLSSEVGELLNAIGKANGKRLKPGDSIDGVTEIGAEIADVAVYLYQIATRYELDFDDCFLTKLQVLRGRFDV